MSGRDHPGHERALRRNVTVGVLGLAARGAQIILFVAVGRVLGPALLGQLLLGLGIFEIATALTATGFVDGTLLLASRRAHRWDAAGGAARATGDGARAIADIVATAWLVGGTLALGLASSVALLVAFLTPAVAGRLPHSVAASYAELLPSLRFIAWALVPSLVARVSFAATTALLRPEWESIVGGGGPALGLLVALPLVRVFGGGACELFAAALGVQAVIAIVGVVALSRQLGAAILVAALRRRRLDRDLLRFVVPQAMNMAATTYIGRLDLLILAASGMPSAVVGAYGTAAAVVRELRQARMIVSGALAPLVARLHATGDRAALAHALSRGSTWVASVVVPLALAFVVVHADILGAVSPAYVGGSGFTLVLLVGPVVNGLGGLSGNFLVFLLRNRLNLANSILVAVANTALGLWLVPRFGLVGAALASAGGLTAVTLLETIELALFEDVRLDPNALVPAAATLAVGALGQSLLGRLGLLGSWQARVVVATALGLIAAASLRTRVGRGRDAAIAGGAS